MKIRFLILVLLTMISLTTTGQTSDSIRIKKWSDRQVKAKRQRDSLEVVFNSIPAFFKISLELDHKEAPLPDNTKFYATNGQTNYESRKTGPDTFEFDDLPDSAKFVLEYDKIKLSTGFEKRNFYKNGAEMRFGYFDNVLKLKELWDKGKKDKDFDEWTEIRHPYLDIIKNKVSIKAAKKGKIRPIEFVAFSPRVYGDGVTHTFQNVRLK